MNKTVNNTMTIDKVDEIKGRKIEVNIINKGSEGDTLCYKVNNEKLGEFVISNCHYTSDPLVCIDAKNHLIGNVALELSDDSTFGFRAELNICNDDPKRCCVVELLNVK